MEQFQWLIDEIKDARGKVITGGNYKLNSHITLREALLMDHTLKNLDY